nr:hypothetical protein [uncultured Rhodopila sp.]
MNEVSKFLSRKPLRPPYPTAAGFRLSAASSIGLFAREQTTL